MRFLLLFLLAGWVPLGLMAQNLSPSVVTNSGFVAAQATGVAGQAATGTGAGVSLGFIPAAFPPTLRIIDPASVSLCPNDTDTVEVVVHGQFNPGNTLELQLSDASGDFSTVTVLQDTAWTNYNTGDVRDTLELLIVADPALAASANYRLRLVSTSPKHLSPAIGYEQIETPNQPTISGTQNICGGNTTTLNASSTVGASFNWYSVATGGAPVFSGNPFTTPQLFSNTIYYAEATLNGCVSTRTAAVVNVTPAVNLPGGSVTANGPVAFCPGGSVTFTAPGGFSVYEWNQDGVQVGVNSNTYTATSSGLVTLRVSNSCGSATASDSFDVQIFTPPTTPFIFNNGGVLTSSAPSGNQWLDANQDTLQGETDPSFTPSAAGTYYVLVTDSNGCSTLSQPFLFTGLSRGAELNAFLSLYPNPASKQAKLQARNLAQGAYQVRLLSPLGQVVYQTTWEVQAELDQLQLPLQQLPTGVYLVRIQDPQNRQGLLRLIKQ